MIEIPAPVMTIIGYAIAVLLGGLGVRPIDWLKHLLNLSGAGALWFLFLVSVVVAAVAIYLGGGLVGFEFDPEHVLAVFGLFLAAATYVYKQLNPVPQS